MPRPRGIEFQLLNNPTRILAGEDGHVTGIELLRQELGEPDAKGRHSPVPVPGSEWVLDVDTVIIAIGTSPNPLIRNTTEGLTFTRKGGIEADEGGARRARGVFAGGDAVTGRHRYPRHGSRQGRRQEHRRVHQEQKNKI